MRALATAGMKRRRRLAAIAAGSVAVHLLILVLIGSYVPRTFWRIRNLDQGAVQVQLERRPRPAPAEPRPRPQALTARRAPTPTTAAASPAPAPAPAPHLPAVPPPPGAPSSWTVGPAQPALPPGFLGSLQAHVGCAGAELARMSPGQREACARQLAEGAAEAPYIQAPIAAEKRAAWDRVVHCRKVYDDAGVPVGTDGWGLGYVPRLRDCGPKDH
jgi:hypothetical protein